jgi:uncharacterized protein with PIN domain
MHEQIYGVGHLRSIFDRCRTECRTLVTTSSKLLQRKDCPPGTYLLNAKSLSDLEGAMVHLLLSHGVKLQPVKMLSRCVVCNGSIEQVQDECKIQEIFRLHGAPDTLLNEVMDVFQCIGCSQGYWWCDKPTSSASRVMNQATKLLELCIRGGVPIDEDLGVFESDISKIRGALHAAPQYSLSVEGEKQEYQGEIKENLISHEILDFSLRGASRSNGESIPGVRYLLDFTLSRFCRWLRILGLDAALETEEEDFERTKHGRM